jgi:hypothetical protein
LSASRLREPSARGIGFVGIGARLALGALALAACAKVGPPPGGPEDREAPTIVKDAVYPPPGAAGVSPGDTVSIVFSELPDRRSVMRALAVFPPVDFRQTSWRGDTLRLAPDPGWAAERNTILRIGPTARDRRGNRLAEAFVLRFTTKSVADSGTIRGRAWAGREKSAEARLLVFATPADSALGAAPASLAEPDKDGAFALEGLDTGAAWRVTALLDADGDARGDGEEATWSAPDTTVFPPGTREAVVPDFLVGTLDSLGHLRGTVRADSGSAVYVVARDLATGATVRAGPLAGGGAFSLDVPTGARYRLGAFVDGDADGERGESERFVERDEDLRLDLVAERGALEFDLRASAAAVPADSAAAPGKPAGAAADSAGAPEGLAPQEDEEGRP